MKDHIENSQNMMTPLFSVIMPAYNRADVISQALDSLIAQTIDNWECLIVDDGSTDNTMDIVIKYANFDSRFVPLTNERRKGACGARNTGILHSRGTYISFLDTDDYFLPNALECQKKTFESDLEIGFMYSDIEFRNRSGDTAPHNMNLGAEGFVYQVALNKGFLSPGLVVSVKRDLLLDVGLWDEEFPASQDDDLCFKLAKRSKVGFYNGILAYAYSSSNQISANLEKTAMGWWMLWNKYETDVIELCGNDVMAKHYKECLHHFIHSNNVKMSWKAYCKYTQFGGYLSKKRQIFLFLYCLSMGKNRRITHKIQKLI